MKDQPNVYQVPDSSLLDQIEKLEKRTRNLTWALILIVVSLAVGLMAFALGSALAHQADENSEPGEPEKPRPTQVELAEIKFIDGVDEITLNGGMVRMDLAVYSRDVDENGKHKLESAGQIVMPPDGFLRSFTAMEDLVKQLIEAGLIKSASDTMDEMGRYP